LNAWTEGCSTYSSERYSDFGGEACCMSADGLWDWRFRDWDAVGDELAATWAEWLWDDACADDMDAVGAVVRGRLGTKFALVVRDAADKLAHAACCEG
jgi:hypothetical protein